MPPKQKPNTMPASSRLLQRARFIHLLSLCVIALVAAANHGLTWRAFDDYFRASDLQVRMDSYISTMKEIVTTCDASLEYAHSPASRREEGDVLTSLVARAKSQREAMLGNLTLVMPTIPDAEQRYQMAENLRGPVFSDIAEIQNYLRHPRDDTKAKAARARLDGAEFSDFVDYSTASALHLGLAVDARAASVRFFGVACVLAVILGLVYEANYQFRPLLARLLEAFRMERDRESIEKENVHLARLQRVTEEAYREVEEHRAVLQQQAEALRIALSRAEEANSLKTMFLANMSHEIRTPLNGVVGMTDILSTTKLSADQKECVQTISISAEALLKIINDILDLSKVEAGKLSVESIPFDLEDILESTIDLHTKIAQDKGIEISWSILPDTETSLLGDSTRIRQICLNLFSNAVKFTKSGSVRMVAETFTNHGRLLLKVTVADTGIGIAPELISKLFDPFMQADGSTTRQYGGTGLGLSIVKQLSELMGGWAGGDSVLGIGSSFWSVVEVQPFVKPPATVQPERVGVPVPLGLRVLLVEDNAVNQLVATRMLQAHACKISFAKNGEEAIELFKSQPFDIILMDIHMPVKDGLTATREIRQLEAVMGTHTPILALTADAMEQDISRALEAGMDDAISKPVRASVIEEKLGHWSVQTV